MGATTIEWTKYVWPIVQGCDLVSPGCTNCYAVPLLWRLQHNPLAKVSDPIAGLVTKNKYGKLHFTGKVALRHDRLEDPLKWKTPRRIFVPSHGDIFHKYVPFDFLDRIFLTMAYARRHTFQVLTKRGDRMQRYITDPETPNRINALLRAETAPYVNWQLKTWPLPNVWLGISAEDQTRLTERWQFLRDTPAALRFLSYEPALEAIDLTAICNGWHFEDALAGVRYHDTPAGGGGATMKIPKLDWGIGGLESGNKAREGNVRWLHSFKNQFQRAGVPVFIKQLGRRPMLDTEPMVLKDRKGGDPEEWPIDLRVRQFPT
jgi:protein gp37